MAKFHGNVLDLAGKRFGRLTVESRDGSNAHGGATWNCICDCGTAIIVPANSLKTGNTQSCGCLSSEVKGDRLRTHGRSKTGEHKSWLWMRNRCYNPNAEKFADYGGRGIYVCLRWRESFKEFFKDMGLRPIGMTIDRIDPNGSYTCGKCDDCIESGAVMNCRWATQDVQANNRRDTVLLTHDGVTQSVGQWAKALLIPYSRIRYRLRHNQPIDEVLRP